MELKATLVRQEPLAQQGPTVPWLDPQVPLAKLDLKALKVMLEQQEPIAL